jgi:hypothetical protein
MAYIPKNKIKTNLYSNGEYAYIDFAKPEQIGASYYGNYYALATGNAFTGKYPGDGKNLPIRKRPLEGPPNVSTPTSLQTSTIPPLYPTPKDYNNGTFIRYFSKKRNEYLFKELTQDEYKALNTTKNSRYFVYKPFYIKWMLTGSKQTVTDFNYWSITTTEKSENVYGLNEFLKMDYLKYYK